MPSLQRQVLYFDLLLLLVIQRLIIRCVDHEAQLSIILCVHLVAAALMVGKVQRQRLLDGHGVRVLEEVHWRRFFSHLTRYNCRPDINKSLS